MVGSEAEKKPRKRSGQRDTRPRRGEEKGSRYYGTVSNALTIISHQTRALMQKHWPQQRGGQRRADGGSVFSVYGI